MLKKILLIISLTFFNIASASNLGFEMIPNANEIKGDKIVIQEFFFYGCPHCKRIEEPLRDWLKKVDVQKVEFQKIPVNFGHKASISAKHYYAAKFLGKEKEFNDIYFKEIIENRKEIKDQLAIKILKDLGERNDSIIKALNSYTVNKNVEEVRELTKKYRINRVPSFIINGNIKIDSETAGSEKLIFDVIDKIVTK